MMLQYFLFIGHANNHSLQKRSQSARKQLLGFSARKRTICHRFLGCSPVRTREYEKSLNDSKTPLSAVLNYRRKGSVFFLKVQIFTLKIHDCLVFTNAIIIADWAVLWWPQKSDFPNSWPTTSPKTPPEDIVSGWKVAGTWKTLSFQTSMAATAYSIKHQANWCQDGRDLCSWSYIENTPHSWEYSLWSWYPVLLGTKKSPNNHMTDDFRVSAALWKTDGRVWAAGANDETMYANSAQANWRQIGWFHSENKTTGDSK